MNVLQEMETYAKAYDIPIMQKEGIDFMCGFIKKQNIKHILEIGSAIGYSAIMMASVHDDIKITTIERDENRFKKAEEYITKSGLSSRITLLYGDALQLDVEGAFDMLFIDAAKAQYTKFFERYEGCLKKQGYVITDNLKFHGYVEHKELITSRSLRQLVNKIQKFVEYLKMRKDYDTTFYDFGDGVGISQKK